MPPNDLPDHVMDTAPCGFIAFTEKGIIVQSNQCLLDYTGYAAHELPGKKIEEIMTLASRIFYQTHFYPLIKLHGKVEEIFLSLASKEKKEIPVLVNAVKIQQADYFVIHCIMMRVVQRGKYEEEILHAKRTAENALNKNEELIKAKQELEAHREELDRKISMLTRKNKELLQYNEVISHDLQEPLRKITLFADVLYRDNIESLSQMSANAIEKINQAATRMREIIFKLEELLSLDTAEKEIGSVDLNKALATAVNTLHQLHPANLQIHAGHLPVIDGYKEQLEKLFYHLLENALKFTRAGEQPVIHITGNIIQHNIYQTTLFNYRYDDFVQIEISDNGIGFENTYNEYIFLVLKKLHTALPGLGFGLALCRKIVNNHFGAISAVSSPGKGASFTILLPVRQQR